MVDSTLAAPTSFFFAPVADPLTALEVAQAFHNLAQAGPGRLIAMRQGEARQTLPPSAEFPDLLRGGWENLPQFRPKLLETKLASGAVLV